MLYVKDNIKNYFPSKFINKIRQQLAMNQGIMFLEGASFFAVETDEED